MLPEELDEVTGDIYQLEGMHKVIPIFTHLQDVVALINKYNGWFANDRTFGEEIALIHSEVSEALEAYRVDKVTASLDANNKPIGVPSELADILIRLMDICYRYDIDLMQATIQKLMFNATRPYRHGDKAL